MNRIIPSLSILEFYKEVLTKYNEYRKEEKLSTFALNASAINVPNTDHGFQINIYLHESGGASGSRFFCQEKLTYRIDMLVINRKQAEDAYRELLVLSHDLRQVIMQLSNRQLNLGFEVSHVSHPSFRVVSHAEDTPDFVSAFGQLEFSMEVNFPYQEEEIEGKQSKEIDWYFHLLMKNKDKNSQFMEEK